MSFVVIFLTLIALLFVLAYVTRRRFGVLGFALAAGAMLSALWVGDLTPIVARAGFILVKPPLESVVAVAIILAPAVLLLFSGPVYHIVWQRALGALAFAVLAATLLLAPLGSALVIEGMGQTVYDFFVQNKNIIITVGLLVALADLLMTKPHKMPKKRA